MHRTFGEKERDLIDLGVTDRDELREMSLEKRFDFVQGHDSSFQTAILRVRRAARSWLRTVFRLS